jgi:uncharacterized repeat protein (TIGR03803 family)
MKLKLGVLIVPALLTCVAYANTQPVVAYTFECKTGAFQGEGPCPQGGRGDLLLQGSDGNFYGTAQVSAEGSSSPLGGTVFSLTPTGKFTLLYTFTPGPSNTYPNGNLPGHLTEGLDGKLYGNTLYGGVGGCNGYCGGGVLYRVNRDGTGFQIIHKGCSQANCVDGSVGPLIVAPDGNLYGAAYTGGTGNCGWYYQGCGTIFRVSPSTGAYSTVVNFEYSTTGAFPSGVTVGPDGTLYGLNFGLSGHNLFHFTPSSGSLKITGLQFPTPNGLPARPGQFILGPNGTFFGLYGIYATAGMGIYEVHPDGSNLHMFAFYTTQAGAGAPDGLLLASDGNFWMANSNGTSGYGNIIELSPVTGQTLKTISPFGANGAAGAYPAEIIQTTDGKFWGSTYQGGKSTTGHFAEGTIFNLNLGLPAR